MIHGIGRMEFRSVGGVYEGEFDNGVRKGYGRLIYYNGSFYEGMFEEGVPNGIGIFGFKEIKYVLREGCSYYYQQ